MTTATTDQPSLFPVPNTEAARREASLEEAFQRFHAENPHVYLKLRGLAFDLLDRGATRLAIAMLWEVMRWQVIRATNAVDYKLNNNHRSRYARLLMAREPRLAGVFEVRHMTSEDDDQEVAS